MLILGRGIWGLGTALYFMNNTTLILDLFDPSIRGRTLGTFQSIEFIGSFIGAPIGAFMAESLANLGNIPIRNYNMVFFIATGLIFTSFILAFLSKRIRQVGMTKSVGSGVSVKEVFFALGNLGVAIICINAFSRMLIMGGINQTILEIYLVEEAKMSVGLIGIILGVRTAGHIISTFAAGYLSDKIGRRPIIIAGMLIESVSFYIYANASSFGIFALAGLIAGLGEGMVFACLLVLLSEIVPARMRGGAIGLYRTFMDLGGFIGPILFMFLFDNIGANSPFYGALVILLLNAALVISMRKVKLVEPQGNAEPLHH